MNSIEQQAAVEAALAADREAALRDVFATAALAGLMGRSAYWDRPDVMTKWAYEFADAMLKARKE